MKNSKALFLDRDGVVNVDYGHVGTIDRFYLIPQVIDLCLSAQSKGYKIVVITNQAGIAKNKFSFEDFIILSNHIIRIFQNNSVKLDIFFCPYHKDAINKKFIINNQLQQENHPSTDVQIINESIYLSQYRKPNPGMIFQASSVLDISLDQSIFIGDQETDIMAAKASDVSYSIMVGDRQAGSADLFMPVLPSSLDEISRMLDKRL